MVPVERRRTAGGQSVHGGRAELDRLLEQAFQCLEATDLRGANDLLKQAGVEASDLFGAAEAESRRDARPMEVEM